MNKERILVAGAGGRLGRMILDQLVQSGNNEIIASSRSPEKLTAYSQQGVDVRFADFNSPPSLKQAFANVDRMLLISTDDLFSGHRVQQHKNAIEAAVAAKVRHIIYTSMPEPEKSKAVPFSPDHVATEKALLESGLTSTILRVAWYAENPLELGLLSAVMRTGNWFTSAGAGKIAYIPRYDVARAAAAVLSRSDETNRIYNITGVQSHTPEELAASLAVATGKPIQVRQVDDETLKRELIASGVAAMLAPMLTSTDANTREGHFDLVTTAVEELTGDPPVSFEHFLWAIRKKLS